jgi:hypothetical protein
MSSSHGDAFEFGVWLLLGNEFRVDARRVVASPVRPEACIS